MLIRIESCGECDWSIFPFCDVPLCGNPKAYKMALMDTDIVHEDCPLRKLAVGEGE